MFGNKFGRHENVDCGLCWILPRKPEEWGPERTAPVPLESVSVLASVVHAVAQVELTQVFVNKEEQPIEAIYYFPIDSNGGVTHFHAELEGRTIKGVVKPEEEAKAQYDKAVSEKQTAFLVESNKPDIFKVRIGFLKPGVQVKVVIGYVTEVKNEKGSNALRFFIPTTVAPRYIPPTETEAKALDLKNMKFSESSPAPLTIRVNVSLQGAIKTIECPTHTVKTVEKGPIPEKPHWTRAIVELTGKTTDMDRDFVLLVTPEEVHVPRLYTEKVEGSTALMAHLIPSFNLDEQKVELIFVLDRSGSMMGQSIELAKTALTLFLHSAPVDCYFNIVGFGSKLEFLFPESVKYDDESLKKAIAHATSLQANLGGTEIYNPLKEVYNKKSIPEYLRQIFVLTDGEVSNTEQVIGLVKANSHSGRLFSLGIGDSSSHHLVEGLAEAGSGTASFVTYNEKIDNKVLQQLKNAIQPSLMDVKITWAGISEPMDTQPIEINKTKTLLGYGKPIETSSTATGPKASYSQVPKMVPPIYDGSQLLVFGLFTAELPTSVAITAQSPDGPLSIDVNLDEKNDLGSNGMIHKLAAIKLIRELELEVAALGHIGSDATKNEETLKNETTQLSLKHGVCSKYTSFVAVDSEGDKPTNENWVMQTRYVPSQTAHGWHGQQRNMMPCPGPAMGVSLHSFGGFGKTCTSSAFSSPMNPFGGSSAFGVPMNTFGGSTTFGSPMNPSGGSSAFGVPMNTFGGSTTFGSPMNPSGGSSAFGVPMNSSGGSSTFGVPMNSFGGSSTFGVPMNSSGGSSLFGVPMNSSGGSSAFGVPMNSFGGSSPFGVPMNSFGGSSTFGAPGNVVKSSAPTQPSVFSFGVQPQSMPVNTHTTFSAYTSDTSSIFCGPSPPPQFTSTSHDPLHTLVGTQSFNGSFPLNEAFAAAVGSSSTALENEAKTKGWDNGAFATALAIAYLEKKLMNLKESWELVAAKAKKWLEKNFPQNHAEILAGAAAFIASTK